MTRSNARWTVLFVALLFATVFPHPVESGTIRASIQPANARKPAPMFRLSDASGKAVRLSDYRGKIVLLNFWATECGGCRLEIPSFLELDQAYGGDGLVVVGVSMDISYEDLRNAQEAWGRVKPFVQTHQIKYPILMGNDEVTKVYDIQALPVTHLIDARGRIAATYVGIVDKNDIEANIKVLLKER
ncbi:MAG TPA: TlpA disulfide reductase family protein [Bryobacteraceae bacterium]|jgi:cytochrome c biogenesis protein CcmG/thiol:disulfide interchange protein DsbE